ncbi:MAG: phosphate ABC transporter permease PstA [Lachnospiraceae bacterium]|nr:phosphate ABC transporter permease PstA [Lachnospiraceae bacterium]
MEKLKMDFKYHKLSLLIRLIVNIAAILTVGALIAIVVYILAKGIPNISPKMFEPKYTSENASVVPALINTLITVVVTLVIAVPIGIFSAIYMAEYAKRGNKLVKVVRLMAETLSGIPSIVFGLFGYLFFVVACKFDYSLLAGSLTLAIMVLPTIMTTTEEALTSIPDSYREGSFGLGAGKLRTVFRVILPSAVPGILAGVILSVGRIIGETAALIYTAGSVAKVPDSLMGSGRTLAVHMYVLFNEGLSMEQAYGTAVVLLVLVLVVNLLSNLAASCLVKKNNQ